MADKKREDYDRLQLGYLPVLSLQIDQVPFALGDPSQAIRIDLLRADPLRKLVMQFTGVLDWKVDRLHPGSTCLLQIASVEDAQLEGIHYQVFNDEQDLTLSFYCRDFSFAEFLL